MEFELVERDFLPVKRGRYGEIVDAVIANAGNSKCVVAKTPADLNSSQFASAVCSSRHFRAAGLRVRTQVQRGGEAVAFWAEKR